MGGVVQRLKVAGGVGETRHAVPVAAVHRGEVIQRHFLRAGVPAGTAAALPEGQLQVKAEVVIHRDQAVLQRAVADRSVSVQRQGAILRQLPLDGRRVAVQHEAARAIGLQLDVVVAQIVHLVHGYPLIKGEDLLAHVLAYGGVDLAAAVSLASAGHQRQRHHQRQQQCRQLLHTSHRVPPIFSYFLLLLSHISVRLI